MNRMKKHNLFLTSGCPGAGKSTYLKNLGDIYVISRDEIRFSLVGDNEEYFSKEDKVFKTFINQIQKAINSDETPIDIYCDATHITKKSRNKLLNALDLSNVEKITVLVLRPSLKETLHRNAQRSGRKYVPPYVVRRMYYQFERPEEDEDRIFDVKYVEVPKDE